jgi:hypothetical protein
MKKLIVAAAGLLLVGMASSAFADAGVSFSGDGRARGFYLQDYNLSDSDTSEWNSRVRLKFKGESKGGAYAVARVRLAEATWDGTQQSRALGESTNFYTDYAYVGVPMGPVAVEAGLMPFNVTTFSVWDVRVDGLHVKYASDSTTLVAFYHKLDEVDEAAIITLPAVPPSTTPTVINNDVVNDDDIDRFGALLDQKFGDFGLVASVWATSNAQGGTDGVAAAAELTGTVGTVGLLADAAYYQADYAGTVDDPVGFYVQAAAPVGPVTLAAGAGYTMDGFKADGDFGPFIMLSDVSNIATGIQIGTGGDTAFAALVPSVKVSEQLTLTAVVAYADIDGPLNSALEVSGSAAYAVTDGATVTAELGYLDFDGAENPAVGAGVILDVKF